VRDVETLQSSFPFTSLRNARFIGAAARIPDLSELNKIEHYRRNLTIFFKRQISTMELATLEVMGMVCRIELRSRQITAEAPRP
jgi:hypothetical protein